MTQLILHYLHRDEGNWKDRFEVCLLNLAGYTAEQAEQMIRERLIDREFFYAHKVGLPSASDSDWHELDCVEEAGDGAVLPAMSLESLLDKLTESNQAHLRPIKIHSIPSGIPIRLAVSWLEFLRELRQALDALAALVHKDSVVMVFRNDTDWNLIDETLRLDAQSGNFERDLRRDIERALNGAKEICDLRSFIHLIRKKENGIQRYVEKVIRRGL